MRFSQEEEELFETLPIIKVKNSAEKLLEFVEYFSENIKPIFFYDSETTQPSSSFLIRIKFFYSQLDCQKKFNFKQIINIISHENF
jgi:hypothetical protein